ncbi:hypothetical protein L6164_006294 [Bauhinia variegata]|uniref:Uncharacterized protein n=1 Tax=Bauhinia variegata TaxID=167791 RepID=A0ACB9PU14_BAUVA|nr:hypothetical protein L6164_006294 [Bauhinia variegata]
MKTALSTLLFFLLYAFTIKLSFTSAEPVLDVNGDLLLPSNQYYVLPLIWALGGGLRPGKIHDSTCPVGVVQDFSELSDGVPLGFSPVPDIGIVPANTPLSIAFAEAPRCAESGTWIVVKEDLREGLSLGIGGPRDHPNHEIVRGHFTIHRDGMGYRINFLPSTGGATSGHVGRIFDQFGKRRLVVTDKDPYLVVFKKASSGVSKI